MKITLNRFGTPSMTLEYESEAEKAYLLILATQFNDQGVDMLMHYPTRSPFSGAFSGITFALKYKQPPPQE